MLVHRQCRTRRHVVSRNNDLSVLLGKTIGCPLDVTVVDNSWVTATSSCS
jgi:hypothetical protein